MAAAVSLGRGAPVTPFGAIAAVARRAADDGAIIRWPSRRWESDPVGFAREALGVALWSGQVDIVESIRDNRNTTVRSGHKCGKTTALAVAALWFYATFPRARVLMTAVKASQVDEVMWKEVRRLYRGAKIPLDGTCNEIARSGIRNSDERQIWGATARDGEGLAGISGPNILILVDEASGIHDRFFEVLGTSLAGSGGTVRKCYISNPTRTTGEFYRSHTTNKALFNALHISSEDTPNARGERVVPGLAGPEWIAERKAEYGEDSHAYRVRVRGEFVHDKDGKIISLDLIALAQAAWDEAPETGSLQLGVDPAGDGVIGDETAIAVRRGNKILTVIAQRGLSEDAVVQMVGEVAKMHRREGEPAPRVAIDCEGGIGTRVLEKLRAYGDAHRDAITIVPVRSGKKLWGSPEFDRVRDGLWGQAQKWLMAGGALPEDVKLAQELNAPSFVADANQRYVATDKKQLRKDLGRSTDRADAVCLAIWGFAEDGSHEEVEAPAAPPAHHDPYREPQARGMDPYGALDAWGNR